jgi:hypothetical protein
MYKMGSYLLSTCTLYSGGSGGREGGYGPTEGMVEQCQFFVGAYGMYLCCGEEGSSNGFGVPYAFTAPQHKISSSLVSHQTLSTGSLYPTKRPNHGTICCRYQDKPLQFIPF